MSCEELARHQRLLLLPENYPWNEMELELKNRLIGHKKECVPCQQKVSLLLQDFKGFKGNLKKIEPEQIFQRNRKEDNQEILLFKNILLKKELDQTQRLREYRQTWFGGFLIFFFLCLLLWMNFWESLPNEIRIATAIQTGLYYQFGNEFKEHLEQWTNETVSVLETKGTAENCQLLHEKKVNLAILQAGAGDMEGISALAPLYHDVIHVIVRQKSNIQTLDDLKGKNVSLGPEGSGMRNSALQILKHYGIDPTSLKNTERYFLTLLKEPEMDAAIVTTGMTNKALLTLLESGEFQLLPVLDFEALAMKYFYLTPLKIPRSIYAPNVPAQSIETVGTTAFLAARTDASNILVEKTLGALYESYQPLGTLVMPLEKAKNVWTIPLHPAVQIYRDPYRGIGLLGDFLEWLAALKEVIFAFFASGYFFWTWKQKIKENKEKQILLTQQSQLSLLMNEVIAVERAHMETNDPILLKQYLDEVTNIKLQALDDLTHGHLRGDDLFSIFLTQCTGVIRKIQEKCIFHFKAQQDPGLQKILEDPRLS
ncbi:MAG: TAXI family TRAP transporter solute-binding subunit [Planctomycetota bacterium]